MTAEHPPRSADLLVVGAGPQALRALADLEIALAERTGVASAAPVHVVAVDPFDAGAGAVWRVDQPASLAMNVAADLVDLRCPSVPWDLPQWHVHEHGTACARYPSRALVGRYLHWAWERLTRSSWLQPVHVRGTVVAVDQVADGWRGRVEGSASDAVITAERVLLCTGHREPTLDYERLVAGDATTTPGSRVLVRGAALTAFDAVVCLTAGRGGTWEPAGPGEVPRYHPSGREPDQMVLLSRSGRMMLPKPVEPTPAVLAAVGELRERWAEVEPLGDAWWDTLIEAARRAAAACDVDLSDAAARSWLDDPPAAADSADVAVRWRADLRRAVGEVDADPAWWLGRAWSAAYADLLASIERLPRDATTWPRFRRRAATLERWAFGPPAELVARLLGLLDEGRLVVSTAATRTTSGLVAHIAPPGVLTDPRPWVEGSTAARESRGRGTAVSPLWDGLLAAGHVTVRPGEAGVLTAPDGTCVRADTSLSHGLSALGRPTEGPVVDHDSLQRRLHLDAARWAATTADALIGRRGSALDLPEMETTA